MGSMFVKKESKVEKADDKDKNFLFFKKKKLSSKEDLTDKEIEKSIEHRKRFGFMSPRKKQKEIEKIEQMNKEEKKHRIFTFLDKFIKFAYKKGQNEEYVDKLENKTDKLVKKTSKSDNNITKKIGGLAKNVWNYIKDPKSDPGLKLAAIGAVIYLLVPVDAVPDIIPVAGFVDDVAALSVVASMIAKNISNIANDTQDAVRTFTKNIADGVTDSLDESVARQSKVRIRQQLVIVAISLGGAIIVGLVTLLMAFIL